MYVEERMYLLHPGKVPEYFKLYVFKERLAKMLAAKAR